MDPIKRGWKRWVIGMSTSVVMLVALALLRWGHTSYQDGHLLSASSSAFIGPIKASANGRYFVDQNNVPWLLMADSPQGFMGVTSPADMALFMAERKAQGFNAIYVVAICGMYFNGCHKNGQALDGTLPFTSGTCPATCDLSTPNPSYFAQLDALIRLAASYGLVVILNPLDTQAWIVTMENNGATKTYNFGAYMGRRYKDFPNIIWQSGNDFQTWSTSLADNYLAHQLMLGVASTDPNHLQGTELNYNFSYGNQNLLLNDVVTIDSAYTYGGTYDEIIQAYKSSPTLPVYLTEANYEGEGQGIGRLTENAGPYVLRKQIYWTMTSGGNGQMWGNTHEDFPMTGGGWQTYINSPGALQISGIRNFFESYHWWKLVPDCTSDCNRGSNHSVVKAGFGTYDASNMTIDTENNYCSTGWSPDGTLAMVYCGGAVGQSSPYTLTVNMSAFSGPIRARWFDPSNGSTGNTYTAIAGSPFANSGTHNFATPGTNGANSAGDYDWVLVLDIP
jgi:hypothetical protein